MSKYGPSSCFLLVGGYDLSSPTFQLKEGIEQLLEQSNGFGENAEAHLPVEVGKITLEASGGFYDDATGGIVEALQEKGNTRLEVDFGMSGLAIGDECVMLDGAFAATWERVAQRDGLTKAHGLYTITGSYLRGKVIHAITSETTASGDTESSSVDNSASSSNGAVCHLHVPVMTLGGYTSVTVKVRHSTDDITYSDLATFTNVTALGSERVTVAGTINRYLAMSWVFNGSGSGQSITPYVSVNRG